MNMNTLMNQMNTLKLDTLLESLQAGSRGGSWQTPVLVGIGISVLIGILWCFFGLKLIRVWSAIFGLLVGFAAGAAGAAALNQQSIVVLIAGAVAGLILAGVSAGLYRVGIFLVALLAGTGIGTAVLQPADWRIALVCLGIGLVLALLTLPLAEPITMILTGLYGAAGAGTGISLLLPLNSPWVRPAVMAVLAVLGICVQFLMESGKRKRRHLERARKIREQYSTANEVEKARAMMNELDGTPIQEKPEEKKTGLRGKGKDKKKENKKKESKKKENKKENPKN